MIIRDIEMPVAYNPDGLAILTRKRSKWYQKLWRRVKCLFQ